MFLTTNMSGAFALTSGKGMCSGGLGLGVASGALRRVEGLGSLGLLWGVWDVT